MLCCMVVQWELRTFATCGGDGTFVCWDKENRSLLALALVGS